MPLIVHTVSVASNKSLSFLLVFAARKRGKQGEHSNDNTGTYAYIVKHETLAASRWFVPSVDILIQTLTRFIIDRL